LFLLFYFSDRKYNLTKHIERRHSRELSNIENSKTEQNVPLNEQNVPLNEQNVPPNEQNVPLLHNCNCDHIEENVSHYYIL
jgi:hypothetical protein